MCFWQGEHGLKGTSDAGMLRRASEYGDRGMFDQDKPHEQHLLENIFFNFLILKASVQI